MDDTDEIKASLRKKRKATKIKDRDLLSTGVTPLNVALSGSPKGGIAKGTYLLYAGDSDSGKSFLARALLAEANINPEFDAYRLIYDDAEYGTTLMDLKKFFGKKLAERIEERHSATVEGMYDDIDNDLAEGTPFIRVVDSMDALTAENDQDQIEKEKKAREGGKGTTGNYGTSKAKANANRLRIVTNAVAANGSILVMIAQLHDNIGFGAMFEPKSMSGGKALKFYAHVVIWTSTKGKIKSGKIKGKERELGIQVLAKIKKNRLSGRKRDVMFPLLHSTGIDDLGACVDYLIEEGHWKKTDGKIRAPEFDFKGDREELIGHIEYGDEEQKLRDLVAEVWSQIEGACEVKRKNRYV